MRALLLLVVLALGAAGGAPSGPRWLDGTPYPAFPVPIRTFEVVWRVHGDPGASPPVLIVTVLPDAGTSVTRQAVLTPRSTNPWRGRLPARGTLLVHAVYRGCILTQQLDLARSALTLRLHLAFRTDTPITLTRTEGAQTLVRTCQ